VFETGGSIPAEALFLEYRAANGEILTPELFPRADGTTWVCAISSIGPLPLDPNDVAADEGATETGGRPLNPRWNELGPVSPARFNLNHG
jgi:hypothetical protein